MKNIIKYFITFIFGVLITIGVVFYELPRLPEESNILLRAWCDGTFIAGVFILSFSLLAIITNEGAFYGISYSFKRIGDALRHPKKTDTSMFNYTKYVQSKKKSKTSYSFSVVIGTVFIVITIILLFFYYYR